MLRADDPMGVNGQQEGAKRVSKGESVLQRALGSRGKVDTADDTTGQTLVDGETTEAATTLDPWTLVSLAGDALREKNYAEAVDFFSQALDVLVPQVGQFARELGPVYTAYGKALLQLGIDNKDSVLLNKAALPESLVEGIAASALPMESADGKAKKAKIVNLDNVTFEGEEEEEEESSNEPTAGQASDGDRSDADGAEGEDEDELQLAWEIFDVARMIYADSASVDAAAKVHLANVHGDLGDVAMEMESFAQAADEFSKALELKTSFGEDVKNGRDIASIYFKLAMALEYDDRLKEAIPPLTTSLSLLKRHLERLSAGTCDADDKGKEKTSRGQPAQTGSDAKEFDELQQLLPEIECKLEDIRGQLRAAAAAKEESLDPTASKVKAAVVAAAQGAIQDLTGLVKKRKSAQE